MSSIENKHRVPGRENPTSNQSLNEVLDYLTDKRRRVLRVLIANNGEMDTRTLAKTVSGTQQGAAGEAPSEETIKQVLIDLTHVQLPALAEAGLITQNEDDDRVLTTDHAVYDDGQFQKLVASDADLEAVLSTLVTLERRRVFAILQAHDGAMDEKYLAGMIADDLDVSQREMYLALHHVHLPKLNSGGIIDFDPATDTGVKLTVSETTREWLNSLQNV